MSELESLKAELARARELLASAREQAEYFLQRYLSMEQECERIRATKTQVGTSNHPGNCHARPPTS